MVRPSIEGPLEELSLADGTTYPWYMTRFDRQGELVSIATRSHLLANIEHQPPSDIFIFCHGWNNDWQAATSLYRKFMATFRTLCDEKGLPAAGGYRPLLLGATWPSATLVLPWEQGPRIGASLDLASVDIARQPSTDHEPYDALVEGLITIAEEKGAEPADEARRLLSQKRPDSATTERLAQLLAEASGQGVSAADLITATNAVEGLSRFGEDLSESTDDDALPGFHGESAEAISGTGSAIPSELTPTAAGAGVNPRSLLRAFSVWTMKDRAGRVGVRGLAPLLREILDRGSSRVHLLGHSFGARVMLSSLAAPCLATARPVRSLLLLQPAVNAWCFADRVPGTEGPGGFREAACGEGGCEPRVELPILCTYSPLDAALCEMFPRAFRRPKDLGESLSDLGIAAPGRSPDGSKAQGVSLDRAPESTDPSPAQSGSDESELGPWSALGAVGPLGLGDELARLPVPSTGESYPWEKARAEGRRILALDGQATISGHGDVTSMAMAWALHSLVKAP